MTAAPADDALDGRVRALLNAAGSNLDDVQALVALGRPAFERVLAAADGEVSFWNGAYPQDYRDGLAAALAAFAAADMPGVLAALEARGWSPERIALCGVARVADARLVPRLLAVFASPSPQTRRAAVLYLGMQRDPRATDALVAALADRSSDVRGTAIAALGELGDPRAIEPLEAFAKKPARNRWLADEALAAVRKIRRSRRRLRGSSPP